MGTTDKQQLFILKLIAALIGASIVLNLGAFIALGVIIAPQLQHAAVQASTLMSHADALLTDPQIQTVLSSATNLSSKAVSMLDFVSAIIDQASTYSTNPVTLNNIETLQLLLKKLRVGIELVDESDLRALMETIAFVRQHRLLENSAFLVDTSTNMIQNNQALLQQMNLTQAMQTATSLLGVVADLLDHLQTTGFNIKL